MRQALQLWPFHDPGGKQVSAALISATLHDGVVAAAVFLAMCLGLIVPRWLERTRDRAPPLKGGRTLSPRRWSPTMTQL